MIRLAKKNGEYFLQESVLKVTNNSKWWNPFAWGDVDVEYEEWRTAETVNLDEDGKDER